MKIRTDYVTNSSSSSFVCVAKVNKNDELMKYMKEEYGKYGLSLMDEYIVTGEKMKETRNHNWKYKEFLDYCKRNNLQVEDTDSFLCASFYAWTTEGDVDGNDAWLYDHIPDKYMEKMYEGECD